MKKQAVIRSDAPHEVSMAQGSHVAKSKNTEHQKLFEPELPPPAKPIPVPAETTSRAKAKLKKTPAAEPRTRTPRQKAAAPTARAPSTPTRPAPPPPADPAAIWEAQSAAQQRLEGLKARNAKLDEQIKRLNQSRHVRGKTA